MINLFLVPVGMGSAARQAQGNSGAGVFSIGTYIVLGFLSIVLLFIIYKNFDKIIDFIFKRSR